jgi:hypothetical protein
VAHHQAASSRLLDVFLQILLPDFGAMHIATAIHGHAFQFSDNSLTSDLQGLGIGPALQLTAA